MLVLRSVLGQAAEERRVCAIQPTSSVQVGLQAVNTGERRERSMESEDGNMENEVKAGRAAHLLNAYIAVDKLVHVRDHHRSLDVHERERRDHITGQGE